jgi:serine/threonine-protein kinase
MTSPGPTTLPPKETRRIRGAADGTLSQHAPNFRLLELAGRGSYGEVWLVQDRRSGRLHALKQLRADCSNPSTGRQLLWNEAEVGRRVQSDHVVRGDAAFLSASPPYLVLEWLSGETLEARLNREQQLSCREAMWIGRQTAQGMYDLLQAGFTHGDIKPSNVFISRSGLVKLIDLGFARPDRRVVDDLTDPARIITGTPEYLAPESLVPGENNGIAKDLYSLGIMLYRMLTGCLPFRGETVAEIVRQQQQAHAPRLRMLAPHVPPEAEHLVHRLLSKHPLRRDRGMRSLVQELIGLELLTLEPSGE